MTQRVIITITNGIVNIEHLDSGVDVLIINNDESPSYLLLDGDGKDTGEVVIITGINGDGTVNVKVIDNLDGILKSKYYSSVEISRLELFETDIDLDDEETDYDLLEEEE